MVTHEDATLLLSYISFLHFECSISSKMSTITLKPCYLAGANLHVKFEMLHFLN